MLARYQQVLRQQYVGRLLITAMLARLPQGMSGLALILFLTPQRGYGRAGIATGVSVATAAISNVLLARAVDRIGARLVLGPAAALYATAMVTLAWSPHRGYGAQVGICAVIGLVTPPVSSVSRGMWPQLLGPEQARVLYGLEATAQELVWISGPAAVALVAGLASPRAAVILSGVTGLVGALAYISAPPFAAARRQAVARDRSRVGRRVFRYALAGICLTMGFNMTDIGVVNFVGGRHASASAGVVLAVWSAGSFIGGLLFGASRAQVSDRTLARSAVFAAAGLAAASLAPGAVGLAVILVFSGAAIAPTLARLYTRMSIAAGQASTTEAFGWLAVGFLAGSSSGAALGGLAVDAVGSRWTFLLAGAAALCAVPVVLARRPVASSRA